MVWVISETLIIRMFEENLLIVASYGKILGRDEKIF